MTNSYDVDHGLSQVAPGPLGLEAPDDTLARTGNTARDQEMYVAGIRTGEENAKHNAAIRAAAGWLPIESAPKDGTPILAFWPGGPAAVVSGRSYGMTLGERIAHVGGRTNAQGYIEFGSPMAVNALIQHVLRDIDCTRQDDDGAYQARYRLPGGQWSSWGHVVCGVKGHEQELRYLPSERRPAPAAGDAQTDAARDVLFERKRQREVEGFDNKHDDHYISGDLAMAGATYAINAAANISAFRWCTKDDAAPDEWPWPNRWWKPSTTRRDLVKAGALILAEIERLDRAAQRKGDA